MKHLLLFSVVIGALLSCSHDPVTGTVVDVNSGSITGKLLTKDETKIDDTVTVWLLKDDSTIGLSKNHIDEDTFPKKYYSTDGTYEFDSLKKGTYRIEVTRGNIVVGSKRGIALEKNKSITVNITILIIINQIFNIWNTENSNNLTVNNFYITNGTIEMTDSGYILSTAETDTLVFEAEIESGEDTSIVTIRIIWDDDGTVTIEIIDGNDDGDLTVSPDPKPKTGNLGSIDITMDEPGTTEVESIFDTSGVPVKSE